MAADPLGAGSLKPDSGLSWCGIPPTSAFAIFFVQPHNTHNQKPAQAPEWVDPWIQLDERSCVVGLGSRSGERRRRLTSQ